MMKISAIAALCLAATVWLVSCNPLSDRAKEIAGTYYEPSVSETTPAMELNPDGTCTIRAILPGVLTYAIKGTWNVLSDTLIVESDGVPVEITGDSTLIGHTATRLARPVSDFNGAQLTLKLHHGDIIYVRR